MIICFIVSPFRRVVFVDIRGTSTRYLYLCIAYIMYTPYIVHITQCGHCTQYTLYIIQCVHCSTLYMNYTTPQVKWARRSKPAVHQRDDCRVWEVPGYGAKQDGILCGDFARLPFLHRRVKRSQVICHIILHRVVIVQCIIYFLNFLTCLTSVIPTALTHQWQEAKGSY